MRPNVMRVSFGLLRIFTTGRRERRLYGSNLCRFLHKKCASPRIEDEVLDPPVALLTVVKDFGMPRTVRSAEPLRWRFRTFAPGSHGGIFTSFSDFAWPHVHSSPLPSSSCLRNGFAFPSVSDRVEISPKPLILTGMRFGNRAVNSSVPPTL